MLALFLMLSGTYYAKNYARINWDNWPAAGPTLDTT